MSMSTNTDKIIPSEKKPPTLKKDWQFYTGMAALILSFMMPLFALLVPLFGLSVAQSAFLMGFLIAGVPDVIFLIAIALLGKDTLQYFIYRMKKTVREAVILKPVSKTRYYVGLTISLLSWLPLYLYGYFPTVLPSGDARIYILIAADISFIVSVFLMGEQFWDKFRHLFIWEKKF